MLEQEDGQGSLADHPGVDLLVERGDDVSGFSSPADAVAKASGQLRSGRPAVHSEGLEGVYDSAPDGQLRMSAAVSFEVLKVGAQFPCTDGGLLNIAVGPKLVSVA